MLLQNLRRVSSQEYASRLGPSQTWAKALDSHSYLCIVCGGDQQGYLCKESRNLFPSGFLSGCNIFLSISCVIGGRKRKLGKNKELGEKNEMQWDKLSLLKCVPVTQRASPSLPLHPMVVTAWAIIDIEERKETWRNNKDNWCKLAACAVLPTAFHSSLRSPSRMCSAISISSKW